MIDKNTRLLPRFAGTPLAVFVFFPLTWWAIPCHAQSSQSMSGQIRMSVDHTKIRNTPKNPNNEFRLVDDGTRMSFRIGEDLGDGLRAFVRLEWALRFDAGIDTIDGLNIVGLNSRRWGRLMFGRAWRHFYHTESDMRDRATSQKADNIAILAFARGGLAVIANTIGTPNIISYETPNWGGLTVDTTYSTNPIFPQEADIGSGTRKGRGWNVNPNLRRENFQIGYSYWDAKSDAPIIADQRSDRFYGSYWSGGWKVGFAWDRSVLKVSGTTVERSNRRAWSLPMHYQFGPHTVSGHYSKALDDKATPTVRDGARMFAIAYTHDLSKRTSVGITHARIRNDAGAAYNFFGTTGPGGSLSAAISAGENPRIWATTIRHTF